MIAIPKVINKFSRVIYAIPRGRVENSTRRIAILEEILYILLTYITLFYFYYVILGNVQEICVLIIINDKKMSEMFGY